MDIFICKVCGHVEFGSVTENCQVCGAPESQFKQNNDVFTESAAASPEADSKHIPAITVEQECGLIPENNCTDIFVRIGKTLHPMTAEHAIQFIDCYVDDLFVAHMSLTPRSNPSACFHLKEKGSRIRIVEYCNKHGYWQAENTI
ncbi:MAG: desulfoferrodoxin family protein [Fibrobacterota bacterium]